MPRMTSSRPAFLASDVYAEQLATFIWDAAARAEAENGHGTQTGATVRMARRAARELLDAVGVDPTGVLVEPVSTASISTEPHYQ